MIHKEIPWALWTDWKLWLVPGNLHLIKVNITQRQNVFFSTNNIFKFAIYHIWQSWKYLENLEENTLGRVILERNSCSEQPGCNFTKTTCLQKRFFTGKFHWKGRESCFLWNSIAHHRNFKQKFKVVFSKR